MTLNRRRRKNGRTNWGKKFFFLRFLGRRFTSTCISHANNLCYPAHLYPSPSSRLIANRYLGSKSSTAYAAMTGRFRTTLRAPSLFQCQKFDLRSRQSRNFVPPAVARFSGNFDENLWRWERGENVSSSTLDAGLQGCGDILGRIFCVVEYLRRGWCVIWKIQADR